MAKTRLSVLGVPFSGADDGITAALTTLAIELPAPSVAIGIAVVPDLTELEIDVPAPATYVVVPELPPLTTLTVALQTPVIQLDVVQHPPAHAVAVALPTPAYIEAATIHSVLTELDIVAPAPAIEIAIVMNLQDPVFVGISLSEMSPGVQLLVTVEDTPAVAIDLPTLEQMIVTVVPLSAPVGLEIVVFPPYVNVIRESFSISDSREMEFLKLVEESIDFAESRIMEFEHTSEEAFSIVDALRRNSNGVVHDILITEETWELADFLRWSDAPPVGWEPFHEFFPGDRDAERLLVGVRITGASTGGRAGVSALTHNVDVEDTRDRGNHEITTAAAEVVNFNRSFYQPPEVTGVYTGGLTPAAIEIYNITTSGFTVRLRDMANPGTFVDGTISWMAEGY